MASSIDNVYLLQAKNQLTRYATGLRLIQQTVSLYLCNNGTDEMGPNILKK
jgi:multisubunit Na+/H+ antiporter MnhC subunit